MEPGDIVQIDTVFVQIAPESHVKHFTAYDPIAKWTVAGVAAATSLFLEKVLAEVDGGSEFKAEFEDACQAKGIVLHEFPPKRPQLNGVVERCNGAWRYEFYAVNDLPTRIDDLRPFVDAFQHRYNHQRPRGALGGATPASYLKTRPDSPRRLIGPEPGQPLGAARVAPYAPMRRRHQNTASPRRHPRCIWSAAPS